MNDERNRLGQLVGELRSQLAASTALDADLRRRLEQTLADVQQALSASGGSASAAAPSGAAALSPTARGGEPLSKRLADATLDFEASHPALAGTVSSLIDALDEWGFRRTGRSPACAW
jgi:hypothetical protein